jgi:hypothetical protein
MKKRFLEDDEGIEKKIIKEEREELRNPWALSSTLHGQCSRINVMRSLPYIFYGVIINESVELTRHMS